MRSKVVPSLGQVGAGVSGSTGRRGLYCPGSQASKKMRLNRSWKKSWKSPNYVCGAGMTGVRVGWTGTRQAPQVSLLCQLYSVATLSLEDSTLSPSDPGLRRAEVCHVCLFSWLGRLPRGFATFLWPHGGSRCEWMKLVQQETPSTRRPGPWL